MNKENWTTENIPDQKGKIIIVTGATSGLGKQASKILSGKNATVVMGVRNLEKAEAVKKEFISSNPTVLIDILKLDLGNLASIKEFAKTFLSKYERLDVLINNAGIMMCPYSKTSDGFEIQMGTNHFGPFALTGLLMPILRETEGARIVSTSSLAHLGGNINFNDIHWEARKYKTNKAYSDSKIANLYFTYEMARRNKNISGFPTVVTAHPGWTKTDLLKHSFMLNT
ncbi:MAG: SDR family NAD(P)-dependent oxidoreductase, partial [Crocinitomicaceae bacterium]|nr:SDR family NAD(P)-dependent oxidoreductase [Crocinitomicaceae bacterium]